MDKSIENHLNKKILGDQPDNPYQTLLSGENTAAQSGQVNHQAEFEASLNKTSPQNNSQATPTIQSDNTYAFEQINSFCRTGSLETGFIEADRRKVEERGQEIRYISFSIFSIIDENQIEEIKARNGVAQINMIMTSEEQFNRFKQFIASLNWNG